MNKSDLDISKLNDCIISLKQCLVDYKNNEDTTVQQYIEDACVKRFEYTVETAWKLMKKYLKLEYGKTEQELTMNNIFRFMEGYGLIKSWEAWRFYYDKRNDTSHEYSQLKAKQILELLDNLIKDCDYLYEHLYQAIGD